MDPYQQQLMAQALMNGNLSSLQSPFAQGQQTLSNQTSMPQQQMQNMQQMSQPMIPGQQAMQQMPGGSQMGGPTGMSW